MRACESSKKKDPRAEHEMNHDKKGTCCQKIYVQSSFDFKEYGSINSYHRHRLFRKLRINIQKRIVKKRHNELVKGIKNAGSF